jgi:hypothetical protein
MRLSRMTSTMFNQNPSKAKKLADKGALVITKYGEATYVLMRYDAFDANWPKSKSLYDALRDPYAAIEGDFVPDRLPLEDRDGGF